MSNTKPKIIYDPQSFSLELEFNEASDPQGVVFQQSTRFSLSVKDLCDQLVEETMEDVVIDENGLSASFMGGKVQVAEAHDAKATHSFWGASGEVAEALALDQCFSNPLNRFATQHFELKEVVGMVAREYAVRKLKQAAQRAIQIPEEQLQAIACSDKTAKIGANLLLNCRKEIAREVGVSLPGLTPAA